MAKNKPVVGVKRIYFTERDARIIETMVLNGKDIDDIARVFDVATATLQKNLNFETNHPLRERYRNAVANVTADATLSLKKIADGYTFTEKETKYALKPLAEPYFLENKGELAKKLENNDYDGFVRLILDGMIDLDSGEVKVNDKYEKPDFRAVSKILEAHEGNIWDLDAKHKAIPIKKIIVNVGNEPQRKREIPAVFTVEAK
jgi:hypothetical protein